MPVRAPQPNDNTKLGKKGWDWLNKGLLSPDNLLAPFSALSNIKNQLSGGPEQPITVDSLRQGQNSMDPNVGFWGRAAQGAAASTAEIASGFTSPLALGLGGAGKLGEAGQFVGKMAGAGFGIQGLVQGGQGIRDMSQHGVTADNLQKTATGLSMGLFGGAGALSRHPAASVEAPPEATAAPPVQSPVPVDPQHAEYAPEANASTPNFAYRSRSIGETGIPSNSPAQATRSLQEAQNYAIHRAEQLGLPQELVRVNLARLGKSSYIENPGPNGHNWIKFAHDLPETAVEGSALPPTPSDSLAPQADAQGGQPLGHEQTQSILDEHNASGGSTFHATDGNLKGKPLWSVSPYPERTMTVDGDLTADHVNSFRSQNADLLSQPDHALGTWKNDDGQHMLDVTQTLSSKSAAIALAKKTNQIGIYGLEHGEYVPTGGTGTALPPKRPSFWDALQFGSGEHGSTNTDLLTGGAFGGHDHSSFDPSRFDQDPSGQSNILAPPGTTARRSQSAPQAKAPKSKVRYKLTTLHEPSEA